MIRWLFGHTDDLGHVHPWNEVIAERHAQATERMLLGATGRSRVVSNRVVEAREAQVQARRQREAMRQAVVLAWKGRG